MHVSNLIIGAGPTGLGAGHRLRELGVEDFLLLERENHVGGLSASFKDEAGFTWDIGGHVVFSHYEYYDNLLDSLLGEECFEHQRVSRVRIADRWVPYPFQNNVRHLPPDMRWDCVQGLLPGHRREEHPTNFREWIEYVFGGGIARHFMLPYNFKVWATPPELMAFDWIGERVSVIDLERVLRNLVLEEDEVSWGPNATFRFPAKGGTGEIYRRIASGIKDRIRLGERVTCLDSSKRKATLASGESITYDRLLNTGPLDLLVRELIDETPDSLKDASRDLAHNSVYVAGVGVDGMREDDTCWMYFPEDNCPFYRLTNFHNYSPNNAAVPGRQRALMAETSMSVHKHEDRSTLMDQTVRGLANTAMMEDKDRVLSRWDMTVDYGYPVPTLGRDRALALIQPWLEERSIYSRGRFGGWRYEVANMDHSVMQGVEWADRVTRGKDETTYSIPTP